MLTVKTHIHNFICIYSNAFLKLCICVVITKSSDNITVVHLHYFYLEYSSWLSKLSSVSALKFRNPKTLKH